MLLARRAIVILAVLISIVGARVPSVTAQDRFLGHVTERAHQISRAGGDGERQLFEEMAKAEKMEPRVIGPDARPLPFGFFSDAVAIVAKGGRGGICTGVLVSRRMVLTAGHCICKLGLGQRLAIDNDSEAKVVLGENVERARAVLRIAGALTYEPDYCANRMQGIDLGLIYLLDSDATGRIRFQEEIQPQFDGIRVAASRLVTSDIYLSRTGALTVVGFGRNNQNTAGVKSFAAVPIASLICGTSLARAMYACRPGEEVVLAGATGDTCSGDSGGPAYVVIGRDYYLAAITSRAIDRRGACGPGGIYSLVTPAVVRWLRERLPNVGDKLYVRE